MRRTMTAGLALAFAACLGTNALAQTGNNSDKDASKRMTIHGVIAGVTVEGETAIDYTTHRAAVAEMTFLTIVGSPRSGSAHDANAPDKDNDNARDQGRRGRRRHNVYVVWLTPKTEFRDATAGGSGPGSGDKDKGTSGEAARTTLDKVEVGDHVEVTFVRRDLAATGGGPEAQRAMRHGRHRTFFGDAVSLTILSTPEDRHDGDQTPRGDQDRNRDDDKDKVKDKK